ncbi:hypothetical protein XFF6990_360033 [Xanthomonas citri pv. fuscans]|uniref:Uncharacterized protein n=1 Tax=Xanthomonas campestris pv. phaseoli TaxID=317013 RepID=A0A7Z7J3B7_XANCH|nr:hypothetical protein XFF6990_360033 [Xanthomonas citri pv. fuscans]SOO24956.1 hypothetical protein XFF6991_420173 [Xanthomonas phaseoli pv. phaseoli]
MIVKIQHFKFYNRVTNEMNSNGPNL